MSQEAPKVEDERPCRPSKNSTSWPADSGADSATSR